ncbi:amidase [Ottowia thiooxydans]|uniref:amidase n=1 Tax=Ottowia thiooxydans TaxID=219182 RepID=UPI0003F4F757|nr:amidase [Ottowia thiooxydans]
MLKPHPISESKVAAALRRIAQCDTELRAWACVATEASIAELAPVDGPLSDLPFGVKDMIDVAGLPTRYGSKGVPGHAAAFDATCVALLRAAGAVPVGKTVTAEYAYVSPGPTRNPHALSHTPGGSSSGSAAAVASGMVPVALGTQTGGSMIRPAAFCGVPGFKPSFGAVARNGMWITCESLDVIGWHAATLQEIEKVAAVLMPYPTVMPAPTRAPVVAVIEQAPGGVPQTVAVDAVRRARDRLEAWGATIAPKPGLAEASHWLDAHHVVMHYEFARSLLPVVRTMEQSLSPELLSAVDRGLSIAHPRYWEMRALQTEQRLRWREQFGDADFVLTFSAYGPAPEGLQSTGASGFNKAWSLLGWPCLHLPTTTTGHGLPIGVQIVGPWGADSKLLAWARLLHPLIDERSALALTAD